MLPTPWTYLHFSRSRSPSLSPRVATSPDRPSSPELVLKSLCGLSEDGDDHPRASCARHLVRIYYIMSPKRKSTRNLLSLTRSNGFRINRIQSTLSSDLEHLFSDTAIALSTGKLSEDDKAKRMADLTECLRT
ncbi:hypothetical protein EDB85DRAFT_730707 [Lactarius pseudohatsudake]|nr:hypothetical protein EDB85DRAFT_730707 [Lactarius pseudohatsudake]